MTSVMATCGLFLLALTVPGLSARAQGLPSAPDPHPARWYIDDVLGPSMVTGAPARSTTAAGATFLMNVGRQGTSRWSYPFSLWVSYNNVPTQILREANQPSGQEDFLAFSLDPSFALARGSRLAVFASAGAGLSLKRVVFLTPNSSCSEAYGCNSPVASETSWQPALDGNLVLTWRIHPQGHVLLVVSPRYDELFTPARQFPGFNHAGTGFFTPTAGIRFELGPQRSRPPTL